MKLKNEALADILTVEIVSMHDGNHWQTGKHNVAPTNRAPKIVTKGRTYTLKVTNTRGGVWDVPSYTVGSGLTHDDKGREQHPSAEEVMHALTMDARCAEDYPAFEDFADSFGYNQDSRDALETYLACGRAYSKLMRMFNGEERMKISEATEDM